MPVQTSVNSPRPSYRQRIIRCDRRWLHFVVLDKTAQAKSRKTFRNHCSGPHASYFTLLERELETSKKCCC